uniref:BFN domain-containing protein n=1 Tax=Oryza nivara TaxID=4536 RepID=A0A0E0IAM1_ORYNI
MSQRKCTKGQKRKVGHLLPTASPSLSGGSSPDKAKAFSSAPTDPHSRSPGEVEKIIHPHLLVPRAPPSTAASSSSSSPVPAFALPPRSRRAHSRRASWFGEGARRPDSALDWNRIQVMQAKLPVTMISNSLTKSGQLGTAFLGSVCKYRNITRLISPIYQPAQKNFAPVCGSFSSSSDGNGYMAGNFSESDEDYVNSTVLEAVEVRSGAEGYVIKMRDGKNLRCVHNNSQGRNIPESAPQPAIVLRIEDGSETLLPIIVLEMPSVLLMAAIRNVHIARPTIYQVVKEMIDKMGYEVKLVRINKRIQEAYCAELFLTKVGDHTESITFDLRPSDAINIAVRCKVPIQVHRSLAYSDGIRSVEPARMAIAAGMSDGLLFTELDRPDGQPCVEAQEFGLIRNMLIAAVEERYKDAATWRDKLILLRDTQL